MISRELKGTSFIRLFGLLKVPLLFYVSPKVVKYDDKDLIVKIPLKRRTKNHLGSMYFGALSVGADLAGGLVAMDRIIELKQDIALSFGEFHAVFHKRAMGDVYFHCDQVEEIKN